MRFWRCVYETFFFAVLTLCTADLVLKCSWLFVMEFINENVYSHRIPKICNLLNILLHEILGLAPAILLTVFFCTVNIVLLLDKLPQTLFRTLL
jgi:hypothetical protein